jgi:uncharacterized protein involved in type VI secretion and phage assembly
VKSLKDPHGEGRIELEFPTLPGSPKSSWAPVAAPLAGKQRGAFFMPEKDDEVLVSFEQGDFDHPFIVGFLWNGVDKPPESDPKNRVIKTPGGHTLRFEDTDSKKKIILKSDAEHSVEIDDAAKKMTLVTKGQLSVVLDDGASSITLSGGGRILEMKSGKVTIQ